MVNVPGDTSQSVRDAPDWVSMPQMTEQHAHRMSPVIYALAILTGLTLSENKALGVMACYLREK